MGVDAQVRYTWVLGEDRQFYHERRIESTVDGSWLLLHHSEGRWEPETDSLRIVQEIGRSRQEDGSYEDLGRRT